jgi:hypothetical protein
MNLRSNVLEIYALKIYFLQRAMHFFIWFSTVVMCHLSL